AEIQPPEKKVEFTTVLPNISTLHGQISHKGIRILKNKRRNNSSSRENRDPNIINSEEDIEDLSDDNNSIRLTVQKRKRLEESSVIENRDPDIVVSEEKLVHLNGENNSIGLRATKKRKRIEKSLPMEKKDQNIIGGEMKQLKPVRSPEIMICNNKTRISKTESSHNSNDSSDIICSQISPQDTITIELIEGTTTIIPMNEYC
ncbi:unnamed protein product, partial [Meganyctiphanes norvegica]